MGEHMNTKKADRVAAILMALAVVLVSALHLWGNRAAQQGFAKSTPAYATGIFGTEIIQIEILADAEDWQQMLENAMAEEFIMADVVVNGTKFQNVGVRPKGNSSLSQVAQSDSERYSLRLQFDQYIKGQTCFGLDSLVLNNMIGDNSYMKEYISYDLMREIGVDAPYFGFADIKVNGEDRGLYLAVELYNESYEQRVFGDTAGMLYNVKSMDMGGKDEDGKQEMPQNRSEQGFGGGRQGQAVASPPNTDASVSTAPKSEEAIPESQQPQEGVNQDTPPTQGDNPQGAVPPTQGNTQGGNPQEGMPQQGMGMGGRGNTGGSLAYSDDDSSSYSAIFGNAVGKSKESDYQRVITALKALSEGRDLEAYLDVDQILRYLAAHTIVVNLDSYSSSMAQNYYLYEREGQITILPWDYNFAWGAFQSRDAASVVNFPIDTPVSGVEMSDRPLLGQLFANEAYLKQYHGYLQELMDGYFADGRFEAKLRQLDALIAPYVEKDPTAFCSYAEYQTAVEALITLGNLRAQSVQGQLDGTVPSTTAEQAAHPDQLINAGDLKLSSLGNMGGGRGQDEGQMPVWQEGGMLQGRSPEGMADVGRAQRDRQGNFERTPPSDVGNTVDSSDSLLITGAAVGCLLIAIVVTARLRRSY